MLTAALCHHASDRPAATFDGLGLVGAGLIDPAKGAAWRLSDLGGAKAKFKELSALPWCLADEEKRQELREKQKQRLLKVYTPFPKKSEPVIA